MNVRQALAAGALLALSGCAMSPSRPSVPLPPALQLDLSELDQDGLRGAPGGKVAVSYEFCIPDTAPHRARVMAIDPTVRFMPHSPGRIQCRSDQCLCVGSTHQPGYRDVLIRLAALPFVDEIRRCDFE